MGKSGRDVRLDLRDWLPWLILFRASRLAASPRLVLLGTLGSIMLWLGWWGIARSLQRIEPIAPAPIRTDAPVEAVREFELEMAEYVAARVRFDTLEQCQTPPWMPGSFISSNVFRSPLEKDGYFAWPVPWSAGLVFVPVAAMVQPLNVLFRCPNTTLAGCLLLTWWLVVWGVLGGAICRIAAVRIAQDGHTGVRQSLRFVLGRLGSFLAAPLLPLLLVAVLVLGLGAGGFVAYSIPYLNILASLFWLFAFLVSGAIVFLLTGLLIGWPLMYASLAVEALERAEAPSRCFNYLITRPLAYVFYMAMAFGHGAFVMVLAVLLLHAVFYVSDYGLSLGNVLAAEQGRSLYAFLPEAGGIREHLGPSRPSAVPEGSQLAAATLVGFWSHFVLVTLLGFAQSFFWVSVTLVYFLLRRDVDSVDFDEVYEEESRSEPFPTAVPLASRRLDKKKTTSEAGGTKVSAVDRPDAAPPTPFGIPPGQEVSDSSSK